MQEHHSAAFTGRTGIRDFLIAFISTAITAGVCFPLSQTIGYQTVGLIFLMVVSLLSLFLGRSALIFVAILNFAVWNFFFITPLYTFRVHSFHDLIALFANLIVALVGSALISRIRKNERILMKSQDRLKILHGFLESLNDAVSIKEVVGRAQDEIRRYFNAETIIYLKEKSGDGLARRPFGNKELDSGDVLASAEAVFGDPAREKAVGQKAINTGIHFFPLVEPRKSIGVIGIRFSDGKLPEEEKMILLKSFIFQISSALEREISIDMAKEKEISSQSEKLFQTILSSLSHELKTPIAVITAAVANMKDERMLSKPGARNQLVSELEFASARLNHLVENILDMTRVESGFLKLNLQPCDISDLIGISVQDARNVLHSHPVKVMTEEDLPMISADITLLRQALVNVLHNAAVYTPEGTAITVSGESAKDGTLKIRVADHGPGIPVEYLVHVFDKFYRVPGSKSGGTGLGLTLTKAIVEAHGGNVIAANLPEGGLEIILEFDTDNKDGSAKELL